MYICVEFSGHNNVHAAAVAEEILTKCTVNDPDYPTIDSEEYSVAFNYEFVEDIRDKKARYNNFR